VYIHTYKDIYIYTYISEYTESKIHSGDTMSIFISALESENKSLAFVDNETVGGMLSYIKEAHLGGFMALLASLGMYICVDIYIHIYVYTYTYICR
jgi:hypothetical protein